MRRRHLARPARIARAALYFLFAAALFAVSALLGGYDPVNRNALYINSPIRSTPQPPRLPPLNALRRSDPVTYTAATFLAAFGFNRVERIADFGQGGRVVLLEVGRGYFPGDLHRFDQAMKVSQGRRLVTQVPIGNPPVTYKSETMLDVEWVHAIAPKARIFVVEIPLVLNPALSREIEKTIERIHPTAVSVSVVPGPASSVQAARLGFGSYRFLWPLSRRFPVFVAAGDAGSRFGIDACPTIVSVGGLQAQPGSVPGPHPVLMPWPDTGGGYADFSVVRPPWQFNHHSLWRVTPDVSMLAGWPGVWVYRGMWVPEGGTSLSTPVWASIWTLADTARLRAAAGPLPNDPNPVLYGLAQRDPGTFRKPSAVLAPDELRKIGLGIPDIPAIVRDLATLRPLPSTPPAIPGLVRGIPNPLVFLAVWTALATFVSLLSSPRFILNGFQELTSAANRVLNPFWTAIPAFLIGQWSYSFPAGPARNAAVALIGVAISAGLAVASFKKQ